MEESSKAGEGIQVGDSVQLRGIGPGTVVSQNPMRVLLDGDAEEYRAGVGRGSTVKVTDMNRVRKLEGFFPDEMKSVHVRQNGAEFDEFDDDASSLGTLLWAAPFSVNDPESYVRARKAFLTWAAQQDFKISLEARSRDLTVGQQVTIQLSGSDASWMDEEFEGQKGTVVSDPSRHGDWVDIELESGVTRKFNRKSVSIVGANDYGVLTESVIGIAFRNTETGEVKSDPTWATHWDHPSGVVPWPLWEAGFMDANGEFLDRMTAMDQVDLTDATKNYLTDPKQQGSEVGLHNPFMHGESYEPGEFVWMGARSGEVIQKSGDYLEVSWNDSQEREWVSISELDPEDDVISQMAKDYEIESFRKEDLNEKSNRHRTDSRISRRAHLGRLAHSSVVENDVISDLKQENDWGKQYMINMLDGTARYAYFKGFNEKGGAIFHNKSKNQYTIIDKEDQDDVFVDELGPSGLTVLNAMPVSALTEGLKHEEAFPDFPDEDDSDVEWDLLKDQKMADEDDDDYAKHAAVADADSTWYEKKKTLIEKAVSVESAWNGLSQAHRGQLLVSVGRPEGAGVISWEGLRSASKDILWDLFYENDFSFHTRAAIGQRAEYANSTTVCRHARNEYEAAGGDWACRDCGSVNLKNDVHHRDGDPHNNAIGNMVPLCRSCHTIRHNKQGSQKQEGLPNAGADLLLGAGYFKSQGDERLTDLQTWTKSGKEPITYNTTTGRWMRGEYEQGEYEELAAALESLMAMAGTATKAGARYYVDPEATEYLCRDCVYFEGSTCNIVEGDISPEGTCKYFDDAYGAMEDSTTTGELLPVAVDKIRRKRINRVSSLTESHEEEFELIPNGTVVTWGEWDQYMGDIQSYDAATHTYTITDFIEDKGADLEVDADQVSIHESLSDRIPWTSDPDRKDYPEPPYEGPAGRDYEIDDDDESVDESVWHYRVQFTNDPVVTHARHSDPDQMWSINGDVNASSTDDAEIKVMSLYPDWDEVEVSQDRDFAEDVDPYKFLPDAMDNTPEMDEYMSAQATKADRWVPAGGGQEVPFTYNNTNWLYVHNFATGKSGYLNLSNDIVTDDYRESKSRQEDWPNAHIEVGDIVWSWSDDSKKDGLVTKVTDKNGPNIVVDWPGLPGLHWESDDELMFQEDMSPRRTESMETVRHWPPVGHLWRKEDRVLGYDVADEPCPACGKMISQGDADEFGVCNDCNDMLDRIIADVE